MARRALDQQLRLGGADTRNHVGVANIAAHVGGAMPAQLLVLH